MGTFKASNFSNTDVSLLPVKLRRDVETACKDVLKIGNYSL